MISWFDMPSQGLSGGGEFEIKELTATENKVYETPGEVYNKVTVNVEGGGGGGDFSTAEVTITGPTEENNLQINGATAVDYHDEEYPEDDESYSIGGVTITSNSVLQIVLYKGRAYVDLLPNPEETEITVSGNIEATFVESRYIITGDCTITIS